MIFHVPFVFGVLTAFATTAFCWAGERVVGRVVEVVHRPDDAIVIDGAQGIVEAKKGSLIFEGDRVLTHGKQSVHLEWAEGSETVLAERSMLIVREVGKRGSFFQLARGTARFRVEKLYSPEHPFEVSTDRGVIQVQGTEFIVEVARTPVDRVKNAYEVDLFVLDGEVHFVRRSAQWNSRDMRVVRAGFHSWVENDWEKPSWPKRFSLKELRADYSPRFFGMGLGRGKVPMDVAKYAYDAKAERLSQLMRSQRSGPSVSWALWAGGLGGGHRYRSWNAPEVLWQGRRRLLTEEQWKQFSGVASSLKVVGRLPAAERWDLRMPPPPEVKTVFIEEEEAGGGGSWRFPLDKDLERGWVGFSGGPPGWDFGAGTLDLIDRGHYDLR